MLGYFENDRERQAKLSKVKKWSLRIGIFLVFVAAVLATTSYSIAGPSGKHQKATFWINIAAFIFLLLGTFSSVSSVIADWILESVIEKENRSQPLSLPPSSSQA